MTKRKIIVINSRLKISKHLYLLNSGYKKTPITFPVISGQAVMLTLKTDHLQK